MEWKDQGWGNQKGKVALFADGARVYTTPTSAPHTLTFFESAEIELAVGVNNFEFKYRVGSGGGHSITITNFAWSSPPWLRSPPPPPMSPGYLQMADGYYMIESGSCGGALISTTSECNSAATALGLPHITVDYTHYAVTNYPPGCVFLGFSLYGFGGGSSGSCSSLKRCICMLKSPPSPPTSPPSPPPPPSSPPLPLPPSPPSLPPSPLLPPSPPVPPQPPPSPPLPPLLPPRTIFGFDFDGTIATSPGWSSGGGDPLASPYAFTKKEGKTPSHGTGPSAGVGGSGSYMYAEASSPRQKGDLFTLAYDGSACADIGLGISTVAFHYHMYGATMGELRLTNPLGVVLWSLSGDQGDSWHATQAHVFSPSFSFEFRCGSDFRGDAAVAQVTVSCGAAPPIPPMSPPLLPPLPSPPSPPPSQPVTSGTCPDVSSSMNTASYSSWCSVSNPLFALCGSLITISMSWKDQGWGHQKGRLGIFTLFDGVAVYTTPQAPHSLTAFLDTIQLPAGVKDLDFRYRVGDGGGHSITIVNFAWSLSLQSPPSTPRPPFPPLSPAPPPLPQPPPSQPTTAFDFSSTTSPGWSSGGGDPPSYAFWQTTGQTTSHGTGPSAGVGGSGSYMYAEASSPRQKGDLFTLAYDGSACADIGLGVSTVAFHYHMYGAAMGELRLTNPLGVVLWSLSGDQGDSWHATQAHVFSPSFTFEYARGLSYTGDAAVAQVTVSCGAAPRPPPQAPPTPSSPPPSPPPLPPPPLLPSFVFSSTDLLKAAAQEYNANRTSIEKYGPIANWDVALISNMDGLFSGLTNLNVDISKWDTSSVTDMSSMFYVMS